MTSVPSTLLLVEGDIIIRHPLAEYLRGCGFKVLQASSGEEARMIMQAPEFNIDIVLADMTTPGSGFELRDWIKVQKLSVEVVLAGSVERSVERAGKICSAGPALAKPYDHFLVLEHIKRSLARRQREAQ